MSALQAFTFEGAEVRTALIDGEPWWIANDVCAALGIANVGNALARLDEDERSSIRLADGSPGNPNRSIVNEPGLYTLLLRSDKPEAKKFKRWVTHEVIPAIRKKGSYEAPSPAPAQREITAAAGALPYREQAEILAILRPALPEPYATATAKVILARAMGERPELDPSETPLYAATFLAEKGHKAKTVAKFQSGFGQRVSNAYLKRHGRRPEKIAGPAGSRIDTVAVYTAEDQPLLEQVYAGMADLIAAFEHGDQIAISA
ncbi:Bro-N domain-containing protein [Streptomyces virginiae]|uniref:BRO-N domain-containing protein n=2 Tax=Streptomyces TaxID=1883 RepID=UPI00068C3331|nr:Bro-N domain-containing protein [Streptomyces virginiae]